VQPELRFTSRPLRFLRAIGSSNKVPMSDISASPMACGRAQTSSSTVGVSYDWPGDTLPYGALLMELDLAKKLDHNVSKKE
jgi:hypothetical protein